MPKEPFTTSVAKIQQYIKSGDIVCNIIGLLAKAKKVEFLNQAHVNAYYRRYKRAAERLSCYPKDRIIKTMAYLVNNADYKWTLETVEKFIDEDLDALEDKKPIIILNNGEKIYDTTRIAELERAGTIYYDKSGWHER